MKPYEHWNEYKLFEFSRPDNRVQAAFYGFVVGVIGMAMEQDFYAGLFLLAFFIATQLWFELAWFLKKKFMYWYIRRQENNPPKRDSGN